VDLELKALLPLRPTDHSSRPWLRRRRDLLLPLQRSARATPHGSDTARTAWCACCRCRRMRRSRDLGSSPCLPRVASRLTGCLAVAAARRSPSRRDSFTVRGWTVFHLPSTHGHLRAVRFLRNGRDSARIPDLDEPSLSRLALPRLPPAMARTPSLWHPVLDTASDPPPPAASLPLHTDLLQPPARRASASSGIPIGSYE